MPKNKSLSQKLSNELNFYKEKLSNEDFEYLYNSIEKKYLGEYYQYASSYNSKVTIGIIST